MQKHHQHNPYLYGTPQPDRKRNQYNVYKLTKLKDGVGRALGVSPVLANFDGVNSHSGGHKEANNDKDKAIRATEK